MNNTPILLTDRITRTRYKRVGTHWSDTPWASWGLAGLILASLVVFGVLGCQKQPEAQKPTAVDPALAPAINSTYDAVFHAGVHVGEVCQSGALTAPECCDLDRLDFAKCAAGLHNAN